VQLVDCHAQEGVMRRGEYQFGGTRKEKEGFVKRRRLTKTKKTRGAGPPVSSSQ